ncbi:hypothetical protein Pmani_030909 [Petrolisthes manimaculis]|uniref:Uncharacterized protein n=1 Tax=Petrolisthes manimaculis TaxID=1843537 RepID=A0AAE1NWN7_9EUCA|nr:hypothetical protein Pmani_030909 [Petrolisthes manimaculis]
MRPTTLSVVKDFDGGIVEDVVRERVSVCESRPMRTPLQDRTDTSGTPEQSSGTVSWVTPSRQPLTPPLSSQQRVEMEIKAPGL